ncbi:right-handed parallel beta-helix repeat-containing protein [Ideonella sp. BN130291]|uniref:right-handed parallel beta-helix repeat-containing protein n=1 Tax=Ideonella sp. BN130291 TaxID=3112940 RepID=UPI002E2769CA|nr:right-handed parallel beta-helix repeat-containing protein [Ideonella sp. BN130291]
MNLLHSFGRCVATFAIILMMALPHAASAQATRTWVSGVGDDANPCSRTAPCKTFAGAISKTAANGEINCLDAGGFGGLTITKSIHIDCGGYIGGVLNAGSTGFVVNGAGINVTLRNLDIEGAGTGVNGVNVLNAASVQIDHVTIRGQSQSGVQVASSGNAHVSITNSMFRENAMHGVLVAPSGSARVAIAFSSLNANGLTGLRVNDNGFAAVSDSILSGNGTHGVTAASNGMPARVSLTRVTTSGNLNAGVLSSGGAATVWLSDVTSMGNAYGLYPGAGGAYISFGNNKIAGNGTADGTPTTTVTPI